MPVADVSPDILRWHLPHFQISASPHAYEEYLDHCREILGAILVVEPILTFLLFRDVRTPNSLVGVTLGVLGTLAATFLFNRPGRRPGFCEI